ncbi:MAG: hypothetical protein D6780_04315 [Candidatus Dadabacteria bacterium]|nr:MAG: hypothetical protein D6780_04315 [Candidatus Dadabacteria bacterium]
MEKKEKKNIKKNRGYTLLEYCAGAAVIAGVVWLAMNALGQNLSQFLNALGQWAVARSQDIQ